MQIKGQQVSRLISFGQYIGVVLRHQSMEFRIRGAKLGETGDLGSLGYVMAVLQVLGFAVRGLCVYWHLRAAPYCEACGKYLKKQSSTTRYTNDTEKLQYVYSGLLAELQKGSSPVAIQLLSGFGTPTLLKGMKLNIELKLWKCVTCPEEFFEAAVNQWNGKDWKAISELHVRDYLPRG